MSSATIGGANAMRQPYRSASHAARGSSISWPDALEALKIPTARPRRAENQRVATSAPKTIAVSPVPKPTMTPQNSTSCQSRVMNRAPTSPISISPRAKRTTLLKPYLSISAAVNGAIRPNRTMRSASAIEICSVLQPNSLVSGTISAPEMPMQPAVVRARRKTMATIAQP